MRIAIVGAGIAGLACAAALGGHAVTVFDKGRRPGGRVATRRAGALRFNHGAQYATARGEGFRAVIDRLRAEGAVAAWPAAGEGRWAGLPGMSALPASLAAACGATLLPERHVANLRRDGDGWAVRHLAAADARPGEVTDTGGTVERFDAVLLAVPHAQAAPLLRVAGQAAFADAVAAVVVAPCWTLMLAFDDRVPGEAVRRDGGADLAWIARENSRPGEGGGPDRWVANASPALSRQWLERDAAAVTPDLVALFRAATGAATAPAYAAAHRWRYALTERALGEPALWDATGRIGACGDWCLDGRVEAAWESGAALAARIGPAT